MLDSIYNMTLKLIKDHNFWHYSIENLSSLHNSIMDVIQCNVS